MITHEKINIDSENLWSLTCKDIIHYWEKLL